jgi:hypothetical protein
MDTDKILIPNNDISIPAYLNTLERTTKVLLNRWQVMESRLHNRSLPVFKIVNKIPDAIGSAFIIEAKGDQYIVTVGHVLDEIDSGTLAIGSDGEKEWLDLAMFRTWFHTPKINGRNNDNLDLAFSLIPMEARPKIANTGVETIKWEECSESLDRISDFVTISGWPSHHAKPNYGTKMIRPEPLAMTMPVAPFDASIREGITEEFNFLIDVSNPRHSKTDQPIENLKISGISGGPVWNIPSVKDFLNGSNEVTLAGIIHGNEPGKHRKLIATRASFILIQLLYAFPKLLYKMPDG